MSPVVLSVRAFVLGGANFIIYGVVSGGALYVVPGLVVAVICTLLI